MELPAFLRRNKEEKPVLTAPTYPSPQGVNKHTPSGDTKTVLVGNRKVLGVPIGPKDRHAATQLPPVPVIVEEDDPLDTLATGMMIAEVLADVSDLGSSSDSGDFSGGGGSFGGGGSSGDY